MDFFSRIRNHEKTPAIQILFNRTAIAAAVAFFPLFIILAFTAPLVIPYFVLISFFFISIGIRNRVLSFILVIPLAFIGKCDGGYVVPVNRIAEQVMCKSTEELKIKTVDLGVVRGTQKGKRPTWYCEEKDGTSREFNGDMGLVLYMLIYLLIGCCVFTLARVVRAVFYEAR